jgi:probable blue pigment (indigoidine) exporter
MKSIFAGIAFAMLWASASVATKKGLVSVQPFVLANIRFIVAGIVLLLITKILGRSIKFSKVEFKQLVIYGFLNVSLYLGLFVWALKHISAGIGTLATATNPLLITVISSIFLGKKSNLGSWAGLFLGLMGVLLATIPLLENAYADTFGLILILLSMLSYSLGTIYFAEQNWALSRLAINGWQVFFGGIIILPITLFYLDLSQNNFDLNFWLSSAWLILPVSIGAVQLWLYLLSQSPLKASMWLFLCPIFGFIYAYFILDEPISWHTFAGTFIVIIGLLIGQSEKLNLTKLTLK